MRKWIDGMECVLGVTVVRALDASRRVPNLITNHHVKEALQVSHRQNELSKGILVPFDEHS